MNQKFDSLQGKLDLLILRTLTGRAAHGYAIAKCILSTSEELLDLETGSIYSALHRLMAKGWVQANWELSDNGKRTRYYRLTREGRKQPLVGDSRVGFFDEYPCFYKTSTVGSMSNRLNSRYRAMIQPNLECISDRSVLDLASHDGRWSFAALKAGARHVLGIEARQSLVDKAINTFHLQNIEPDTFNFVSDDVHHYLPSIRPGSIDTVFCFGFFYHTMYHHSLLCSIAALKPKHLILDTRVFQSDDAVIRIKAESTDDPANAVASSVDRLETSLVGHPSRWAIELMLTNFGFRFRYFDWLSMPVDDWRSIEDYRDGRRITLRADLQTP